MFIDVTRYGGMRLQRLAVAAIAYLDAVEGGCAVHLIGGETLRVNEDAAEIEGRCMAIASHAPAPDPSIDPAREAAADRVLEAAGIISTAEAVSRDVDRIIERNDRERYPAKRAARGRQAR